MLLDLWALYTASRVALGEITLDASPGVTVDVVEPSESLSIAIVAETVTITIEADS